VDVISESGNVVPGVENIIYVVASYPDGTPARTSFTLLYENRELARGETDGQGLGEVRFVPPGGASSPPAPPPGFLPRRLDFPPPKVVY
jgi:hypothetical protein